jgi:N-acetylated-alpha-linked acidic dipeptidase
VRSIFAAALIVTGTLAGMARPSPPLPFGFTQEGATIERAAESRFLSLPSAERIRESHRYLTDKPHVAGSERDRVLAEWVRDRFVSAGLERIEIATHEVLLPWPEEVTVEMTAPRAWRASMREDPVDGDPYTQIPAEVAGIPYLAHSASGDVTAPVVYAGSGNPDDYDRLRRAGIDVRGKIALVRYSIPYSYRGFKALTAERRGAAGILIYSDPEDDGEVKGKVYPEGPWGPLSHIQRGAIVYDFMVPGDPLTPGWASTPGARRIDPSAAMSLPKIVGAPLSYKDARVILDALGNPHRSRAVPRGDMNVLVHMRVRSDDRIRPIWTVTGLLRGSERPDDLVIVGNHRDAWIYGGVDPSSGSAALVELALTLGELARGGWRPKRSILFASWDAEEFTLTSSTEWGEEHEAQLGEHAVAYLNVDSAASGPQFSAAAVPSLNRVITEAAELVRDPGTRTPIAAVTRARSAHERGAVPTGPGDGLISNQLGSGSDYTVFLNHLGVPVADLSFDGPYGVYHSIYDNHNWVSRIGDPGFRYHVALVQLWGIVALRLACADTIPLDYEPYATRIVEFANEIERRWPVKAGTHGDFGRIQRAATDLRNAAAAANKKREDALSQGDRTQFAAIDRQLVAAERALLDPDGIPERPWYRHLIYAPKFTYRPELLPGVAEAVEAQDASRVAQQIDRLAAAIGRAAAALR